MDNKSYQMSSYEQLGETTSNIEEEAYREHVQCHLSKLIIRPWEEIKNTKHCTWLGYDKGVSFNIMDCYILIQLQIFLFLQDDSSLPILAQLQC